MTSKRILEFLTYAGIGGTQQMLLEYLRYARHDPRLRYAVCVLLEHDMLNTELSQLGIENISLNMRGYWDFRAWWSFYTYIIGNRFDLLRTYGLKADLIGRIIGRLAGIPVNITSVRSTDPWRTWYHVWLDRLTAPLTDLYVSNSEAGRQAIHHRERIALERIITLPNGIDLSRFRAYHVRMSEFSRRSRTQLGISLSAPVLGIVANLGRMKGHRTIFDALPIIQRVYPDIRCVCIGRDDLNGQLQRYVQERHVENAVIFTGMRRDIPELLSMLDIVVLPSLWEGFPTSLLEAMAMKKPVIASAVGGIPEMIASGRTGLLVPPQQPDKLAQAVIGILQDPVMARNLAEAAYHYVSIYFTLQALVERTEQLYLRLIAQKRGVAELEPVLSSGKDV